MSLWCAVMDFEGVNYFSLPGIGPESTVTKNKEATDDD